MTKSNEVKKDIAALKNEIELQLKMSTNYNTKQIKKNFKQLRFLQRVDIYLNSLPANNIVNYLQGTKEKILIEIEDLQKETYINNRGKLQYKEARLIKQKKQQLKTILFILC